MCAAFYSLGILFVFCLFSVRFIQILSLDQIAKGFGSDGVCVRVYCLHNSHLASIFNVLTRKLVQFHSTAFSFFHSLVKKISLKRNEKKVPRIFDKPIFYCARAHHFIFILHWIKTRLFKFMFVSLCH